MEKHLCWILFVLSFTGTLNAGGGETQPRLEHFQCYPVLRANPEVEAGVGLFDQFTLSLSTNLEDRFEKARVLGANWFCNPTRKLHSGQAFDVRDARQHLTFYWIRAERSEPQRVVKIRNQFGEQSLQLHESLFWLYRPRRLFTTTLWTSVTSSVTGPLDAESQGRVCA